MNMAKHKTQSKTPSGINPVLFFFISSLLSLMDSGRNGAIARARAEMQRNGQMDLR
jgi:hypothetical protein